jgi:Glycosyl hydrolase catalytic core
MSAQRAAQLWPQVQSIAQRRNLLLVSPAVNFCGGGCHDTDPFRYLRDFFAACQGCKVDHIAIHIYVACNGGTNRAQYLINHINSYKSQFSQPLWLTEFACDNAATMEDQRRFMVDALTFLENDPRIYRYAWFSGRTSAIRNASLLAGSGVLTALGDAYVNAPHNAACTP